MNGVTVVIPSRTASNLESCVFSIMSNEKPLPRIIVVDDGLKFSNGEQKMMIESHCQIVTGEKPFVFSRNCNIGIEKAGRDDVILLNDDCLLKTPGGFSMMQMTAHYNRGYGIISASSNNVGNVNMHPRTPKDLREDPRMVCFVCVLIPRRTIEEVGTLDERFVHYGMDDDDYSLRVRNAGRKIGILDACRVDHGSLPSTYRGTGGGDFSKNLEIFKQKWGTDNFGRKV